MPTIRTTLEPWREIVVTESEYLSLLRQGLIYDDEPPPPPPPSFTDQQYDELDDPDSEAATRIVEAVLASIDSGGLVAAATAAVIAEVGPDIDAAEAAAAAAASAANAAQTTANAAGAEAAAAVPNSEAGRTALAESAEVVAAIGDVAQPLGVSFQQNPTMVKPLATALFMLADQVASSLYWPRLVDLRVDGGTYAEPWVYFYSTDHAAVHADSGFFAASGATPFAIDTFHGRIYRDDVGGGTQSETPDPIWDAKANLWRIFGQKAGVSGTNSLQVTLMYTAPAGELLNGAAWTRVGVVIDAIPSSPIPGESKHLGYFDAYKDRTGWYGTGLVGGTFGGSRTYRSVDGAVWFPTGRVPAMHPYAFTVDGVVPSTERWASLRPKPFIWRGEQWGLWAVQKSASGTEDTFAARMAVGRLSPDMRCPTSPLVDITPPVQAWESSTVAGTSMDSVGKPVPYQNVLLVPFRSGLGEGGISVATIGA